MDDILDILLQDARIKPQEIAKLTGKTKADVEKTIKKYEKSGVIAKYKTIVDRSLLKEDDASVLAAIEVSITPQKDAGFDAIAERIYSFPEVSTCFLVSGAYDLLVIIEGKSLQTVAEFVASKLSPMPYVRSTSTHFLLKKYKEDGHIFKKKKQSKRLNISY